MKAKLSTTDRSYHLAHSSGIAQAAICGLKFKLPHVMGVTRPREESFISGSITHDVLEQAYETFLPLWHSQASANKIVAEWIPYFEQVVERFKWDEYGRIDLDHYVTIARSRLTGIAEILSQRMQNETAPIRILSEVTITNPYVKHEGRIDAIFEHSNSVETIDWKTYSDRGISDYDRYQIISNGMLVNYRYDKMEDDFFQNVLTIITPSKIHHPRPTAIKLSKIREARGYILSVLRGENIKAKLPYFAICNSCPYLYPCRYYMNDPTDPEKKRMLTNRRIRVLKKRERTHVNKILVGNLTLEELRELNIVDYSYYLKDIKSLNDVNTLILEKFEMGQKLYKGDNVRIIGSEKNIPILACVSCTGTIRELDNNQAFVDVYRGNPNQLINLPIILLKTDVDLTRRELESIDAIHRGGGRIQQIAYALLGGTK